MKALLFIIFLLFDCRAYAQKAPGLVVSWRVRTGLDRPENVHFSKSTGNFYVTNVAGPYGAKDGSGWVTQILPGGTVISEKWVSGLNAPKGIAGDASTLWVTDIDEVVLIDIQTARILTRISIPGAAYLNGIALTGSQEAYVADTIKNRIYRIHDGHVEMFLQSSELNRPNGLAMISPREIAIASSGSRQSRGQVLVLNTIKKSVTKIATKPGTYDGIAVTAEGDFVVSDYRAGKVYLINRKGERETILAGLFGPAGLDYEPQGTFAVIAESENGSVTLFDAATPASGLSH